MLTGLLRKHAAATCLLDTLSTASQLTFCARLQIFSDFFFFAYVEEQILESWYFCFGNCESEEEQCVNVRQTEETCIFLLSNLTNNKRRCSVNVCCEEVVHPFQLSESLWGYYFCHHLSPAASFPSSWHHDVGIHNKVCKSWEMWAFHLFFFGSLLFICSKDIHAIYFCSFFGGFFSLFFFNKGKKRWGCGKKERRV